MLPEFKFLCLYLTDVDCVKHHEQVCMLILT